MQKFQIEIEEISQRVEEVEANWCQNRYMDTFYERVYNRLCTLIRKECVEDG